MSVSTVSFEFNNHFVNDANMTSSYNLMKAFYENSMFFFFISVCHSFCLFVCFMNKHKTTENRMNQNNACAFFRFLPLRAKLLVVSVYITYPLTRIIVLKTLNKYRCYSIRKFSV